MRKPRLGLNDLQEVTGLGLWGGPSVPREAALCDAHCGEGGRPCAATSASWSRQDLAAAGIHPPSSGHCFGLAVTEACPAGQAGTTGPPESLWGLGWPEAASGGPVGISLPHRWAPSRWDPRSSRLPGQVGHTGTKLTRAHAGDFSGFDYTMKGEEPSLVCPTARQKDLHVEYKGRAFPSPGNLPARLPRLSPGSSPWQDDSCSSREASSS